jgi:hypothetical protein
MKCLEERVSVFLHLLSHTRQNAPTTLPPLLESKFVMYSDPPEPLQAVVRIGLRLLYSA